MQHGLVSYITSVIGTTLRVFLLLSILGIFGIQTTSFAALIAGAGLAVGAAASGLLSNFAAGAFLQGLRPFKVGDYVIAGNVEGTVEEVGMLVTTIVTPDHVHTLVPNGKLLTDTVKNFSANDYRRVELEANLEEGDDVVKAIELLQSSLQTVPNQATNKPPVVDLLEFKKKGPRLAVWLYTPRNIIGRFILTLIASSPTFCCAIISSRQPFQAMILQAWCPAPISQPG